MSLCLANHPMQQEIFPGVKDLSKMEENVEDVIKEDEEVNVLQDESLGKGQEDGVVDIEQWHTLENTGDNGKLEERYSDGDKMRSGDVDLARCNEEKVCTDDFQGRCSGDDQENCSNDNAKGDGEDEPKRCNDGRVVPTKKGREVLNTMEELDVKRGLAENEGSEEHIFFWKKSEQMKGVNHDTREEDDHNVTLSPQKNTNYYI